MTKYKAVAFILISILLSCKSKTTNYSTVIVKNDTIINTVRIPDQHYDIEITYYKNNRTLYSKKYQNHWHYTNEYFTKNDSILLLNRIGKEGVIRENMAEVESNNQKLYYMYEQYYDFTVKNNGIVLEKKMPFYKEDDKDEKVKEFEQMPLKKAKITNEEYSNFYKEYKKLIK